LHLVHHTTGAVATAIVAGALALTSCGGSGSSTPPAAEQGADLGQPPSLANCTDWQKATLRERYGTIREIRDFAGGPVGSAPGGHGATLPDDKAYELFERWCANYYARGFKLYKLYTRAAAFQGRR
jgi:hypothetical protein